MAESGRSGATRKPQTASRRAPTPSPEGPRRTAFRRFTGGIAEQEDALPSRAPASGPSTLPLRSDDAHYAFLGPVGEGAMGRVLLARDRRLLRRVAFKEMSDELVHQPELASKFQLEALITAQLDHPNIVPVYALEGKNAYAMKLIQGRTLEALLDDWRAAAREPARRADGMPLFGRIELFLEVCEAIWYAHSRGVIHRDLKPENIMVGTFGEVYVMDWGIARVFRSDVPDPVDLGGLPVADEGELILGTPGYMSPEQADGQNQALDGASDQYALGLVLFELLTLAHAVPGKAPLKIVMRHQDGEYEPIRHIAGDAIPSELAAICRKALAKDKRGRYPNVFEFAEDLRRFLRNEPTVALPDGVSRRVQRVVGRHPVLAMGAVLLVVFASLFAGVTAVAATQVQLSRAEAREQRMSTLLTTVAHQTSLIDGQFLKYEGLLSLVAATATDALTAPGAPPASEVHWLTDFDTPGALPEQPVARRYGKPISLDYPVFLATTPSEPGLQDAAARLAGIRNHQLRALLRSHSEQAATYTPARAWRAISEVGVPVTWAYIGLETGLYDRFPGHGGLPADYDPRQAAWYALAKGKHGPTWGAPAVDASGAGLVLSCAQSLYDADERLLGVAGIDVSFDYLIESLLEAPEFAQVPGVTFALLDPAGQVAVNSARKGKRVETGNEGRTLRMQEFGVPEVVAAIRDKRSGHHLGWTTQGRELTVYNRMNATGWYYVVTGPADALLGFAD